MHTEKYLEPNQISMMELFSLWLSHILKTIELSLGFIFYTTHSVMKKLTTLKTSGEKVLLKIERFFFFEVRKLRSGMASSIKNVF